MAQAAQAAAAAAVAAVNLDLAKIREASAEDGRRTVLILGRGLYAVHLARVLGYTSSSGGNNSDGSPEVPSSAAPRLVLGTSDPGEWVGSSRLVDATCVLPHPVHEGRAYAAQAGALAACCGADVVFPVGDEGLCLGGSMRVFLTSHRSTCNELGTTQPAPHVYMEDSLELLVRLHSKAGFMELLEEIGVAHPTTALVDSERSIHKALSRMGWAAGGTCPVLVAKQVFGLGGVNMLWYRGEEGEGEGEAAVKEGGGSSEAGGRRGRRCSRDGRDGDGAEVAKAVAAAAAAGAEGAKEKGAAAAPTTPVFNGGGGGGGGGRRARSRSSPRSARRSLRGEQKGEEEEDEGKDEGKLQEQEEKGEVQEQLPPALSTFVSALAAAASPSNPFVVQRAVRGRELSIFCACDRGAVLAACVYTPDKTFANSDRAFFLSRGSIRHE